MMNSSSGGEGSSTPIMRTVPVKYQNVPPQIVCLPNSAPASMGSVKMLTNPPVSLPRGTQVRVVPAEGRSLLSKPSGPIIVNNKNQTLLFRTVQKTPNLDPRSLKYIGTIINSNKSESSPQQDSEVVIVSRSDSPSTNVSYKSGKPFILPAPTAKRPQVMLTTEGTLATKPSLVQTCPLTGGRQVVTMLPTSENKEEKPKKMVVPFSQIPAGYKPVLVPVKMAGRKNDSSLSGNSSAPTYSNFQITNGQLVSEKQGRIVSLMDENCRGFEVIQPGKYIKTETVKLETKPDGISILRNKTLPVRNEPADETKPQTEKGKSDVEAEEKPSEEMDISKCLDWAENIGSLVGSELKFQLNELGVIELLDDMLTVVQKTTTTSRRKKPQVARNTDEIFPCHQCRTYVLASELVNSKYCSQDCSEKQAAEKALSIKKSQEKQERKMKMKQEKNLLLQQRAHLEKLGLNEAKFAIDEKIKKLKMQWELTKMGDVISDEDSGVSLPDGFRQPFSWNRYLSKLKAKYAPYNLFREPFPADKNHFKAGMKLEGIDPVHPSLFCVLSVAEVHGYRIKLHFDGYPDCHDFWVNANSTDIFHAGWCERTGHKLSAPKDYGEKPFNWSNYLRMTRTMAAPKSCFVNNQEKTLIPSGFRSGMKLEAVDKKNSSLICVATIMDVLDTRILVHFDSWDDIYDYWVDCSSPYIHPVGWCSENGHQLTPPNTYKTPHCFSWDYYLHETKSQAAPARAFKTRPPLDFRRGMKLECVDKRNPVLVRVTTVVDVIAHQIKVKFDGWPDQFAYWIDDDCPDIHPQGWCLRTGHLLEPPPCARDLESTSPCPTPGCRGIGDVKGKRSHHNMIVSCPYSSLNYLRDDHIRDRFGSKTEYYEVKDSSLSKGTKPRPALARKRRSEDEVEPEVVKVKTETRGRKRKSYLSVEKNRSERTTLEERDSRRTSIEPATPPPTPSKKKLPIDVTKEEEPVSPALNKSYWHVSNMAKEVGPDPQQWSPQQVSRFVESLMECKDKAKLFEEQQVDGEAFLMLCQGDLMKVLGFKLGPAVKLYNGITSLRRQVLGQVPAT